MSPHHRGLSGSRCWQGQHLCGMTGTFSSRKEKKKKKNPRMGRNVFSNIPSGPCVYGRFTRARHPPSASRPSQKPRPKHLHCRGPNHLTAFAFPGLIAPQNRFPEVRLLVQAVCKLRPLRAGTHLPPPRGAAPGTPDPPRLRTPDASKDLTSQLWNSQNRRSTPSRRCGDPEYPCQASPG